MRTQNTKGADLIPETQTNKSPPSDVLDMMIVMNERDLDVLYSVSLKKTHAAVPKVHGEENDDYYGL